MPEGIVVRQDMYTWCESCAQYELNGNVSRSEDYPLQMNSDDYSSLGSGGTATVFSSGGFVGPAAPTVGRIGSWQVLANSGFNYNVGVDPFSAFSVSTIPSVSTTPEEVTAVPVNIDEAVEKLFDHMITSHFSGIARRAEARTEHGVAARNFIRNHLMNVSESTFEDMAHYQSEGSSNKARWYVQIDDWTEPVKYSIRCDGWYGVNLAGIYRTETEGTPFAEAVAQIKAALPKDIYTRAVKAGIQFRTNRTGIYAQIVADTLSKVPVGGSGADRFVGPFALERALKQVEAFKSNLMDAYRKKLRANQKIDVRVSKPVRSGQGNQYAFIDRIHAERTSEVKIVTLLPVADQHTLASRDFGIEVEVAGAYGCKRPAGWGAKGDGSLYEPYYDHKASHTSRDWEPDTCSVCAIAKPAWERGENSTREFVSPILHSFHSDGLKALLADVALQPQNDSMGIHVHVAVDDLTVKQIGSLVYGYSVIEPLLESSYNRTKREYCRQRPTEELKSIGKSVKQLSSMGQVSELTSIDTGDRYVTLNLQAIADHGTVEFRAMGPAAGYGESDNGVDYEYVIRWAALCRDLVNVAKAGVTPSEWNKAGRSFNDLYSLLLRKGKEFAVAGLQAMEVGDIEAIFERNRGNIKWADDGPRLVSVAGQI